MDSAVWTDNGFESMAAMAAAHSVLMMAIDGAAPLNTVLDLGCGDGRLLYRIQERYIARTIGVEIEPTRADNGRRRHPDVEILTEDMFALDWSRIPLGDLAILMPRLLLEAEPRRAEHLRRELRMRYDRLIVYGCDELSQFDSLQGLAVAAGLSWHLIAQVAHSDSCAALLDWNAEWSR